MIKKIILIILSILVCSCDRKNPERRMNSTNEDYRIALLFEIDGIRLYRFRDDFRYIYFCSSGRTMNEQSYSNGKGRISCQQEIETMERE